MHLILHLFDDDSVLKSFDGYVLAKAGDKEAALSLIGENVLPWLVSIKHRLPCDAGRDKKFSPSKRIIGLLNERFGDEIKRIFGIALPALTVNEANYLVGFRSIDEIRNRCFKARKEIDLRLRSKGIVKVP
jgi:hypothetical protein